MFGNGERPTPGLSALIAALLLTACHGVDPLLTKPPLPTRPDAVLRTPPALQSALTKALVDEAAVRALLSQALWSDALSQPTADFRRALLAQRPALATHAEALQPLLGTLFTQAAAVGTGARQISLRLAAMEQVRQQTNFNAYVSQRTDLFNRRAEAQQAARRAGGAAAGQSVQVAALQAVNQSGRVERIDYVNSAGRVVESRYTAAHDDKQRARLLLPFAHAAAREQAERAALETEQAERLALVINATRDSRIESVERHLFDESDRITNHWWPRLDEHQRELLRAMDQFTRLSGQPLAAPTFPSTATR